MVKQRKMKIMRLIEGFKKINLNIFGQREFSKHWNKLNNFIIQDNSNNDPQNTKNINEKLQSKTIYET